MHNQLSILGSPTPVFYENAHQKKHPQLPKLYIYSIPSFIFENLINLYISQALK